MTGGEGGDNSKGQEQEIGGSRRLTINCLVLDVFDYQARFTGGEGSVLTSKRGTHPRAEVGSETKGRDYQVIQNSRRD